MLQRPLRGSYGSKATDRTGDDLPIHVLEHQYELTATLTRPVRVGYLCLTASTNYHEPRLTSKQNRDLCGQKYSEAVYTTERSIFEIPEA
jgi:hypothetical protein